jgi:coproporphyrinogen III oxidase
MINKEMITEGLKALQDRICKGLEEMDGKAKFVQDLWERPGGGGGRTRLIQNGNVLVKGGVNFSAVHGQMPANLMRKVLEVETGSNEAVDFYATGVSIVLHPESPMVPITHMNVRYFEVNEDIWWFGGGIDLTPHYVTPELAQEFHLKMKAVCDRFHPSYYERFKEWCDDYFYLPHRNEMRGIGGIFFDRLGNEEPLSKEELFEFIIAVGDTFVPAYVQQVEATKDQAYGEQEKAWQALRRGRYVEFNLVLDRGTKFGLQTNGRTESILMSMPPTAGWEYCHEPQIGSAEAETLKWLKKGINWLELETAKA